MQLNEFDFTTKTEIGLLVCAGGFEKRSLSFVNNLRKTRITVEQSVILRYESQKDDNEPNFQKLKSRLQVLTNDESKVIPINAAMPIDSCRNIEAQIRDSAIQISNRSAFVDISGMTHLWALNTIHACVSRSLRTSVICSEARWYYPPKSKKDVVIRSWKDNKYKIAARYLQSAGLNAVHILPQFGGNFRPGRRICLMIFVGYEPNRIQGLVDDYAPGAVVLLYGKSPHEELHWRTQFSRDLHEELFSKWYVRETEASTLLVDEILTKLEEEFQVISMEYDIAIAPQCSKLQALASYLFWRKHPEVQLLFTSPVRFNPDRYSSGVRRIFVYEIK